MKEVVYDVETTTFEKGNPFSRRNRLCLGGTLRDGVSRTYDVEYSDHPYGEALRNLVGEVESAGILIGFNIKFDLHWLKRYANNVRFPARVWDCQLADFLLYNQSDPYPSLDGCAARYGGPYKDDTVEREYWSKGFDTTDVPFDILDTYLRRDLEVTHALYVNQKRLFEQGDSRQYALFKAQCADLLVLQDAEFNGMLFDTEKSIALAAECEQGIQELDRSLIALIGDSELNWNSGDHLSCILYGGTIYRKARVPTARTLKDGSVKHGEKWGEVGTEFRGMVKPLPRSETKPSNAWDDEELERINKERESRKLRPIVRIFSTDEPTLRQLTPKSKRGKEFIQLILRRATLEKLLSTYYKGLPDLINKKDWNENEIHGQFNQVVAATGRLSSSGPNQQNFASDTKQLFYSRYV